MMAFTGTDVLAIVRPQVNDSDATTWGDAVFLPFLNEGCRRIYNEHPESRLTSAGVLNSWTDLTDMATTVPLDDIYKNVIAEYLMFRFFDAEGDTHDKVRALEHEGRFLELIGEK
jgi:alpha-glucosidase (family GH31 glycosyl hydrolase)